MQGIKSAISALAVHPTETKLAIAGADGFILLWDYMKKSDPIHNYENLKQEKNDKNQDFRYFTCMEFSSSTNELLMAQYNGEIKVCDAETLTFKKLNSPLKVSETNPKAFATQMVFSSDGKYFSVCDNMCSVLLFKHSHYQNDPA